MLASNAVADESSLRLKPAADVELVRARCSSCHSIDYIQMNGGFLKRAGWDAEVRKMIKVMGAPVPDGEVERIIEYLATQYGVP
ncbi:MAG: cytochrome c [Proteobacteria bacterium]|nr:cytochrome c [Pseudomonadota bacterium]